ncbi:hypothetical protein L1887_51216 [Cichorium endivia]|nr:hypothetical protein L1887_51216 [Cichorium endivia]
MAHVLGIDLDQLERLDDQQRDSSSEPSGALGNGGRDRGGRPVAHRGALETAPREAGRRTQEPWVVGPEALELEAILGKDRATQTAASSSPRSEAAPGADGSLPPSIIQQVALERAKALAREVRTVPSSDPPQTDASLANLVAQLSPSTSQPSSA